MQLPRDRQYDKTHRVWNYFMYILCVSCRSENRVDPLYILVEVEGRAQCNQPLRLGDCHAGIELGTVCGELRARKTRYAVCTTIPDYADMTMVTSGERNRERFNA